MGWVADGGAVWVVGGPPEWAEAAVRSGMERGFREGLVGVVAAVVGLLVARLAERVDQDRGGGGPCRGQALVGRRAERVAHRSDCADLESLGYLPQVFGCCDYIYIGSYEIIPREDLGAQEKL